MILFKSGQLSQSEKKILEKLIQEIPDDYNDFYITKNNLRLYIKQNMSLFYQCIREGDKIVYSENNGILLISGYSDNAPRKYLKILAKDNKSVERLFSVLFWNISYDYLWIKLKKKNTLVKILQSEKEYKENGLNFRVKGHRGEEILLVKKYFKYNNVVKKEGVKNVADNKN